VRSRIRSAGGTSFSIWGGAGAEKEKKHEIKWNIKHQRSDHHRPRQKKETATIPKELSGKRGISSKRRRRRRRKPREKRKAELGRRRLLLSEEGRILHQRKLVSLSSGKAGETLGIA